LHEHVHKDVLIQKLKDATLSSLVNSRYIRWRPNWWPMRPTIDITVILD